MTEPIKVPEIIKQRIIQLQSNVMAAQAILNAYLEGCQHGLQLEGDWNLDLSKWIFEHIEEKKE